MHIPESRTTDQPLKQNLREWRCDCGRLLFKGELMMGIIEAKCPRCKRVVYLQEFISITANKQSFMGILDLKGNILSVNSGLESVLGYTQKQLMSLELKDFLPIKSHKVINFWLKKISKLRSADTPYLTAVLPVINSQGESIDLACFAKCISLDGRWVILVIAEEDPDAIDRYLSKLSKSAKDNEYEKFKDAWDFTIGRDGIIKRVSPHNILGYTTDNMPTDSSVFSLFDDSEKSNQAIKDLRKDIASSDVAGLKVSMKNSQGQFIPVEASITADLSTPPEDVDLIVSLIFLD